MLEHKRGAEEEFLDQGICSFTVWDMQTLWIALLSFWNTTMTWMKKPFSPPGTILIPFPYGCFCVIPRNLPVAWSMLLLSDLHTSRSNTSAWTIQLENIYVLFLHSHLLSMPSSSCNHGCCAMCPKPHQCIPTHWHSADSMKELLSEKGDNFSSPKVGNGKFTVTNPASLASNPAVTNCSGANHQTVGNSRLCTQWMITHGAIANIPSHSYSFPSCSAVYPFLFTPKEIQDGGVYLHTSLSCSKWEEVPQQSTFHHTFLFDLKTVA